MSRRTKTQIVEDKKNQHNKKVNVLKKLNGHLNSISAMNDEETQRIYVFMNLFVKCELVYKTLYPEMVKIKDNEDCDVRKLNFNVQKFEAALRFFGISYNHEQMKMIFGAKKSYLVLRDKIMHGLNKDSIDTILQNYEIMVRSMSSFLENVAKGLLV